MNYPIHNLTSHTRSQPQDCTTQTPSVSVHLMQQRPFKNIWAGIEKHLRKDTNTIRQGKHVLKKQTTVVIKKKNTVCLACKTETETQKSLPPRSADF